MTRQSVWGRKELKALLSRYQLKLCAFSTYLEVMRATPSYWAGPGADSRSKAAPGQVKPASSKSG